MPIAFWCRGPFAPGSRSHDCRRPSRQDASPPRRPADQRLRRGL